MTTTLTPVLKQRFVDNNGNALYLGQLASYQAGTTTPLATYTDSTGNTQNANPIILDTRGEANVWIPPNVAYKFALSDSNGNAIWTIDNVINSQLLTLYGGVDTGSVNAYLITFAANFSAYSDGIAIYWIPSHTNTGASTINVNGLGVKNIINQDGTALIAGQLVANQIAFILYKGGSFLLSSPLGTAGVLGVGGINFTGAALPTNGFYLPSANVIGISINGVQLGTFSSTALTVPIVNGATTLGFTIGGSSAGSVSAARQWQLYEPGFSTAAAKNAATFDSGSFTGTLTGMTATITGTVNWIRTGNIVTMYCTADITGTSNTTGMTMTGVPAVIQPVNTASSLCGPMENGSTTNVIGNATVTAGTVTFGLYVGGVLNTAGWSNIGVKGVLSGWSIRYPLQ